MSDMDPLTEGVVDTQLAMPAVTAWSEERQLPAGGYYGRDWRVRDDWRGFLKYVMPVVLVVTVLSFVFGGGHRSESPVVAPPTSAVVVQPTVTPMPPSPPPLPETIDEKFVAALINHGAEITKSKIAIHNAHSVCGDLAHGTDRTLIANSIRDATDGYTDERAAIFVALAALFYCPDYAA